MHVPVDMYPIGMKILIAIAPENFHSKIYQKHLRYIQVPNGKLAVGCTVGMVFTGKLH